MEFKPVQFKKSFVFCSFKQKQHGYRKKNLHFSNSNHSGCRSHLHTIDNYSVYIGHTFLVSDSGNQKNIVES